MLLYIICWNSAETIGIINCNLLNSTFCTVLFCAYYPVILCLFYDNFCFHLGLILKNNFSCIWFFVLKMLSYYGQCQHSQCPQHTSFDSKPAVQWIQAPLLTFHIKFVCCHSNKTWEPIANLSNSAQLGGTPYHSPKFHLNLCSSVGMWRGTNTDRRTDGLGHDTLHFAMQNAKCNNLTHSDSTQ